MKTVKRIVWVVGGVDQVGGGERLLFEAKDSLERMGVEVQVLTWNFDPVALFDGRYSAKGITVLGGDKYATPPRGFGQKFFRRLRTLLSARQEIRRFDPDFIICQSEYEAAFLWIVSAFTGYRYVVKVFGQMFLTADEPAKYFYPFKSHFLEIRNSLQSYRDTIGLSPPRLSTVDSILIQLACFVRYFAIRKAALVLTLSPQSSWEVKKLYGRDSIVLRSGFPARLLGYVPKGVVRAKWRIDGNSKIVTCFSRLLPKKRIDVAIKAFAILAPEYSDVHMLVCGRGPEAENLQKLARDLNISHRVTFAGYIEEAVVMDYLYESDIVVNLDVAQFDIVALEAIAAGKRVVGLKENEFDSVFQSAGCILGADPEPESVAVTLRDALALPQVDRSPALLAALQSLTWDAYAETLVRHLSASQLR